MKNVARIAGMGWAESTRSKRNDGGFPRNARQVVRLFIPPGVGLNESKSRQALSPSSFMVSLSCGVRKSTVREKYKISNPWHFLRYASLPPMLWGRFDAFLNVRWLK